jgi:hypothetical protein
VETAFLWWYAADSTIPLCNNRVYYPWNDGMLEYWNTG